MAFTRDLTERVAQLREIAFGDPEVWGSEDIAIAQRDLNELYPYVIEEDDGSNDIAF